MPGKIKVRHTGRYVVCPASGILHHPENGTVWMAVKIKERAFADCGCSSRVFLSPAWEAGMGFTHEEIKALPGKHTVAG